jgi:hypothetical protein
VKQTPILVNDSPQKLAPRDKTKALGSQKVGLKSEQPRVTRLEYLIVPSGTKKI